MPDVGTSLVDQGSRICLPTQGVWVQALIRELRVLMPCGRKNPNRNNRSNIVTNSIKALKMVHIKKNLFEKRRIPVRTSWGRFQQQEGLSQSGTPLLGKHCCWNISSLSGYASRPLGGRVAKPKIPEQDDSRARVSIEITAKFTFWQLWSSKAKETSSLSKTIPLLQPGASLNKPDIPLPWVNSFGPPSIYPLIHPSICTPIHTSNLPHIL